MKRFPHRPYFLLILFFLCLMSLPRSVSERIRSVAVCSFAPGWRSVDFLKEKTLFLLTLPVTSSQMRSETKREYERVLQENQQLQAHFQRVKEWFANEERIQREVARYTQLSGNKMKNPFFERRAQELKGQLELELRSLPARVVFRQPASWSSSCWINVGEKDNERLGEQIVCKNSPVIVSGSVVGVIEQVGLFQSRVRFLTDSSLVLSVRAVRGDELNQHLLTQLDPLLTTLEHRTDLFVSQVDRQAALQALLRLKATLATESESLYLAKGELRGSSAPLWRSRLSTLKGVGFNYDFPDREGPARDLRSGEAYGATRRRAPLSLLAVGDLLITTGLDGFFPPGFKVATVSRIGLLKEGASSYELEAIPTVGDLDALSQVFVLPPYTVPK